VFILGLILTCRTLRMYGARRRRAPPAEAHQLEEDEFPAVLPQLWNILRGMDEPSLKSVQPLSVEQISGSQEEVNVHRITVLISMPLPHDGRSRRLELGLHNYAA